MKLKHSHGWFAAGPEVARALQCLSDGGFRLYLYLCLQARNAQILHAHRSTLLLMLPSHKKAMPAIKAAQQRVEKATQERDKAREKLKKAQTRLALEKQQLKKSQEQLES
jgi:hypothetical protein